MLREVGILTKAKDNTEKFDFTKFDYLKVYQTLKDEILKAFKQTLPFEVNEENIIFLQDIHSDTGFGVVKEHDQRYYLVLNLEICVETKEDEENLFFNLMLTPFNAVMGREKETDFDCSICNKNITKVWRKFLSSESDLVKTKFAENWKAAFKDYNQTIKAINDANLVN